MSVILFTKTFEQKMLQKVELSSLGGKERKIPFWFDVSISSELSRSILLSRNEACHWVNFDLSLEP